MQLTQAALVISGDFTSRDITHATTLQPSRILRPKAGGQAGIPVEEFIIETPIRKTPSTSESIADLLSLI